MLYQAYFHGHAAQPLVHLSRSLPPRHLSRDSRSPCYIPLAQIVGIEGVEHAFSASGVLGSYVRAHSVSSKALTVAFPVEPLTLAEAVGCTCLASSLPRHLQEVSVANRRVSPGARCNSAAVMDSSSIRSRGVTEASYSPKALCDTTVRQTSPSRCSGLLSDRTQGSTHLFNTGEGALLVSTAQGEIELSPSQLVPRALGIAARATRSRHTLSLP
jgi:hypothetical protein